MESELLAKPFVDLIKELKWPVVVLILILILLVIYREQFFRWLKKVTIELGGLKLALEGRAPAPNDIPPAAGARLRLSEEGLAVLSTLWRHQQTYFRNEHDKGRWSFLVFSGSPNYQTYVLGLAETMRLGLVTLSPKDQQCILTNAGIEYCKSFPDQLLPDWDYQRWKRID